MTKTLSEQVDASTQATDDEPRHRRGRRILVLGMLAATAIAAALTVSSIRGRTTKRDRRTRKSRHRH